MDSQNKSFNILNIVEDGRVVNEQSSEMDKELEDFEQNAMEYQTI